MNPHGGGATPTNVRRQRKTRTVFARYVAFFHPSK
jgi:hypothetical protein